MRLRTALSNVVPEIIGNTRDARGLLRQRPRLRSALPMLVHLRGWFGVVRPALGNGAAIGAVAGLVFMLQVDVDARVIVVRQHADGPARLHNVPLAVIRLAVVDKIVSADKTYDVLGRTGIRSEEHTSE